MLHRTHAYLPCRRRETPRRQGRHGEDYDGCLWHLDNDEQPCFTIVYVVFVDKDDKFLATSKEEQSNMSHGATLMLAAVAAGNQPTSRSSEASLRYARSNRPRGEIVGHDAHSNSIYSMPGYNTHHAVSRMARASAEQGIRRYSMIMQLQLKRPAPAPDKAKAGKKSAQQDADLTAAHTLEQLNRTPSKATRQKPDKDEHSSWRKSCPTILSDVRKECPDFVIRRFWRRKTCPQHSMVCPNCLSILKDLPGHLSRNRCKPDVWPGAKKACACKTE
jgi:hypothetical protein